MSLFGMAKKTIKDYFKTVDTFIKDLPATIQCRSMRGIRCRPRAHRRKVGGGEYQKISPEDQVRIAQYSARNGISAALHHTIKPPCLTKKEQMQDMVRGMCPQSGCLSGLPPRKDGYCFWLSVHTEDQTAPADAPQTSMYT